MADDIILSTSDVDRMLNKPVAISYFRIFSSLDFARDLELVERVLFIGVLWIF